MAADPTASPTATGPAPGTPLRTLTGLAGYRCGHTGSCCRAGWPIPVEPAPVQILRTAERQGVLPVVSDPWITDEILGRTPHNHCVFHAPAESAGGCRLERAIGSEALPYSCRQFPRVLLADGRGWHVSLSAWCGTAAAMIVSPAGRSTSTPGPCQELRQFLSFDHIDADPRVHVESLDARDTWPPLLRPGVLAGLEAYDRWESRVITDWLGAVGVANQSTAAILMDVLRWTDWVREWRPADGALPVRVGKPWQRRTALALHPAQSGGDAPLRGVLKDLMSRVPPEWRADEWPGGLTDSDLSGPEMSRPAFEAAVARYLSTRLVASWVAYHGRGLRSVLASLVSSHALVTLALSDNGHGAVTVGRVTSAIRAADWLQLHLLDREAWAAWCSGAEADRDASALVSVVAAAERVLGSLAWGPSSPGAS